VDHFRLHIPMKIGTIVQEVAVARWVAHARLADERPGCRCCALDITARTGGNVAVERGDEGWIASVKRGGTIAARWQAPIFPMMGPHMVGVGEENRRPWTDARQGCGVLRGPRRRLGEGAHLDHGADHDHRDRLRWVGSSLISMYPTVVRSLQPHRIAQRSDRAEIGQQLPARHRTGGRGRRAKFQKLRSHQLAPPAAATCARRPDLPLRRRCPVHPGRAATIACRSARARAARRRGRPLAPRRSHDRGLGKGDQGTVVGVWRRRACFLEQRTRAGAAPAPHGSSKLARPGGCRLAAPMPRILLQLACSRPACACQLENQARRRRGCSWTGPVRGGRPLRLGAHSRGSRRPSLGTRSGRGFGAGARRSHRDRARRWPLRSERHFLARPTPAGRGAGTSGVPAPPPDRAGAGRDRPRARTAAALVRAGRSPSA